MAAEQNENESSRVQMALFRVEAMAEDIGEMKDSMRQLASAVSKLAVIEERQSNDRGNISRILLTLENHASRIGSLEQDRPLSKRTTEWVEKVTWLVVGGVISAVLALVIVKTQPQSQHLSTAEIPQLTMPTK